MGQQMIHALDADDRRKGLVDPGIVGCELGRLVGGDVQGVEAPLVPAPAPDLFLEGIRQVLLADEIQEGGVGVQGGHHHLTAKDASLVSDLDSGGAAVFDQDPRHRRGLEDQAAALDDLARQRAGKLVGAAVAVTLVHGAIQH
jgi:hypothetical protein